MSDLIDRQKAITAICEDGTWLESQGCTEITMCERKQRDVDILSELPTADTDISGYSDRLWKTAYERGKTEGIVRCKECIWRLGTDCTRFAEVLVSLDDYCSRAERKRSR